MTVVTSAQTSYQNQPGYNDCLLPPTNASFLASAAKSSATITGDSKNAASDGSTESEVDLKDLIDAQLVKLLTMPTSLPDREFTHYKAKLTTNLPRDLHLVQAWLSALDESTMRASRKNSKRCGSRLLTTCSTTMAFRSGLCRYAKLLRAWSFLNRHAPSSTLKSCFAFLIDDLPAWKLFVSFLSFVITTISTTTTHTHHFCWALSVRILFIFPIQQTLCFISSMPPVNIIEKKKKCECGLKIHWLFILLLSFRLR